MTQLGIDCGLDYYIEKYGEDNARYLMETMGNWTANYHNLAYIRTGLPQDDAYSELARQEAIRRQLLYKEIQGSMSLLERMVNAQWDHDEFLVISPGEKIIADDSGQVLGME